MKVFIVLALLAILAALGGAGVFMLRKGQAPVDPQARDKRRQVVDLIEAHGLRDFALDRADEHIASAKARLAALPRNSFRDALETLSDYVVVRRR